MGRGARITGRAAGLPWARLITLARAAPLAKRHWDKLTPAERRRIRELVRKSKGRRSNLTARERATLRELVGKLELRDLARDLAALGSPLPPPRRRRRGQ